MVVYTAHIFLILRPPPKIWIHTSKEYISTCGWATTCEEACPRSRAVWGCIPIRPCVYLVAGCGYIYITKYRKHTLFRVAPHEKEKLSAASSSSCTPSGYIRYRTLPSLVPQINIAIERTGVVLSRFWPLCPPNISMTAEEEGMIYTWLWKDPFLQKLSGFTGEKSIDSISV